MRQLKSRPQIREELSQLTGPLDDLIYEEGPIHPECWEFSNDHRGVERPLIHPQRMIRINGYLKRKSIEAGEW